VGASAEPTRATRFPAQADTAAEFDCVGRASDVEAAFNVDAGEGERQRQHETGANGDLGRALHAPAHHAPAGSPVAIDGEREAGYRRERRQQREYKRLCWWLDNPEGGEFAKAVGERQRGGVVHHVRGSPSIEGQEACSQGKKRCDATKHAAHHQRQTREVAPRVLN
jgi:hypothetical protein